MTPAVMSSSLVYLMDMLALLPVKVCLMYFLACLEKNYHPPMDLEKLLRKAGERPVICIEMDAMSMASALLIMILSRGLFMCKLARLVLLVSNLHSSSWRLLCAQ